MAPRELPGTRGTNRGFLAATGLVFAATGLSSALVYGASVVASRWLGPAGYGVVGAMLGLTVLLTVPAYAVQLLAAREVAGHRDAPQRIADVLRARLVAAFVVGGLVTVVGLILSGLTADLLNIASPWPVVVTVLATVPLLVTAVLRGVLQGDGRYGAMAANMVWEGSARVIAVVVAFTAGGGTTAVCAAPVISVVVSALSGGHALRPYLRLRGVHRARTNPPRGVVAAGTFYAAFAALTNTDVLVAKQALGEVASGEYAA